MAVCDSSQSLPKLQIEAVLSVRPLKVTEPRRIRQVLMSDTDSIVKAKGFHGCYQMVLYYESLKEEEGDKFLAGWIVESLSSALVEHPLLSGRLKRKDNDDEQKGLLEIVSNDSGIRLYEVRFPMVLSEFLALSAEREHLEAELVFWKEIDERNPQFSPLFYVQVTQFECGGYTIGITCSLLLADVLVVENFLKAWADIHNSMLLQRKEIKTPIFYHPLCRNYESPPADVINRTRSRKSHSIAFKVTAKDLNFNKEFWRDVAMLCVEEAEKKLHKRKWTEFNLFVNESSEVIKVEGHSKNAYCKKVLDQNVIKNEISGDTGNDFGECVMFHEGNKPVLVSRWIGLNGEDGNVIVVPCPEENASAVITVSFP